MVTTFKWNILNKSILMLKIFMSFLNEPKLKYILKFLQSTTRGGLNLRYLPSPRTQLQGRLDLVASDLWLSYDPSLTTQQTKRVLRRFVGLSVQHTLGDAGTPGNRFSVTAELLDTYTFDDQLGRAYNDQLLLGFLYRVTPALTLSLHQETDPRADERQYPRVGDHFATTVGASLRLSEALYAQASETVRWSGENATLLGLRLPLFGAGSVYGNERLSLRGGQLLSTSVLGAEDKLGPTLRTYGEWQLDGQAEGASQRAVLGLVNRWELKPGLWASLAYEHAQVLGRTGLVPGAVPGGTLGGVNGIAPLAGPFLNPPASCIPGSTPAPGAPPQQGGAGCSPQLAYGASYNPAGGYFPGASQRDSGSASLEATADPRFKGSAKAEVRRDRADPALVGVVPGVDDRLHLLFSGDATMKWTDDLGLLARLHWARSTAGSTGRIESQWLEATAGLALRPVRRDTFNVLLKVTHLLDQRPIELTSGLGDEQTSDVVSVSPTLELPWRFAVAEKLAFKHVQSRVADGPQLDANLLLWVNRLDWHFLTKADLSGEFRLLSLRGPLAGDTGGHGDSERGFLLEAAFRPAKYTRIGAGWNFTSFSDDELARYDRSSGGFFIRAVGEY